jgi:hypothetical protein
MRSILIFSIIALAGMSGCKSKETQTSSKGATVKVNFAGPMNLFTLWQGIEVNGYLIKANPTKPIQKLVDVKKGLYSFAINNSLHGFVYLEPGSSVEVDISPQGITIKDDKNKKVNTFLVNYQQEFNAVAAQYLPKMTGVGKMSANDFKASLDQFHTALVSMIKDKKLPNDIEPKILDRSLSIKNIILMKFLDRKFTNAQVNLALKALNESDYNDENKAAQDEFYLQGTAMYYLIHMKKELNRNRNVEKAYEYLVQKGLSPILAERVIIMTLKNEGLNKNETEVALQKFNKPEYRDFLTTSVQH